MPAEAGRPRGHLLDFIEYFSGKAAITKSMLEVGMKVKCFDKIYGPPEHDSSKPVGFRTWLLTLACAKPGAGVWFGVECTTWIWVSRFAMKRNKRIWFGDEGRPHV